MDAHSSDTAKELRGFGPLGLLAGLVILAGGLAGPVVASVLVLLWAVASRTAPRALGLAPPRSWPATLAGGAVLGVVLKLGMKAFVMPLLGAPAMNMPYHYLAGNAAALPGIIATVLISASIGEEVFYRGYLFERLGALLGQGRAALAFTVVLSAGLFALAHYPGQGVPGVQQAAVTGLVFGGIYARQRQIWLLMVAHAAFDLIAVALIYWSLEEAVARSVFG